MLFWPTVIAECARPQQQMYCAAPAGVERRNLDGLLWKIKRVLVPAQWQNLSLTWFWVWHFSPVTILHIAPCFILRSAAFAAVLRRTDLWSKKVLLHSACARLHAWFGHWHSEHSNSWTKLSLTPGSPGSPSHWQHFTVGEGCTLILTLLTMFQINCVPNQNHIIQKI